MSKSSRNNPKRAGGSESRDTFYEFNERFPDDAACLEWLVGYLYPDGIYCPTCQRVTKHHRDKNRPSFQCQFCGHREHPMVGTIFEASATSLRLWFHGIYLMSQTRCGISAKQLERELGVTYKTAWRMFNKIRSLLDQDDDMFEGTVEADEAYFGGKDKWKHASKRPRIGRGPVSKTTVFGMAQRRHGDESARVVAKVVEGSSEADLIPEVRTKVMPKSTVYTDEWRPYNRLGDVGYEHSRVSHSQKVYVSGDAHTNTIEGFWALVKRGIGGTHHAVSTKHLQGYLDEYVFRYNNRSNPYGMLNAFLGRIEKASPVPLPPEVAS